MEEKCKKGEKTASKKKKKCFYPTWQEASRVAVGLKIRYRKEYKENRWKDPCLHGRPDIFYSDFPGFEVFLKADESDIVAYFYPTWQEAAKAALKLGIDCKADYELLYSHDYRLHSAPASYYHDFPGFKIFLSDYYKTWQEASEVAIVLGVKNKVDYNNRRSRDPKLPSNPEVYYRDSGFPGWRSFLER